MGLYDTIHALIRCPKCNGSVEEFQTKVFQGKCCRNFHFSHEHDATCKKVPSLCRENDKIPVHELKTDNKQAGFFVAYTHCRSPECEFNAMREHILDQEKTGFPNKLRPKREITIWNYAGRSLEIKVYFNRKTGMMLRVKVIAHDDPDPKELARAVEVLAKSRGKEWTSALEECGDAYLAMRKLAK